MANVNINLNQYLNNTYQSLPKTEGRLDSSAVNSELKDAVTLLKDVASGDVVKGTILDMVGNEVKVGMGSQGTLSALLTGDVGVNIGDVVSFEVNKSNPEQIVLKALDAGTSDNSASVRFASNALEQAMVPINEKNTAIVMELVKNNMSINKDALAEFSRLTKMYPEVSAKTLVDLTKLGVPVNSENIIQYENYQNYEHSISDKLPAITESLTQMLENTEDLQVLKDIVSFDYEGELSVPAKEALGEQGLADLSKLAKEPELKEAIMKGDMPLKEAVGKLLEENMKLPDKEVLDSPVLKKALKEIVDDRFLMKPADVGKNGEIKDFYTKMLKETANISRVLQEAGKGNSELASSVKDIRQNVTFMNDLNQAMAYVQLPLKFANQNVHSDLYVFKDKRKPIDKDNISALLHLDMDNLGSMDIYVNLTNQNNLSTKFMLENEEMLDFIMEHIDILDERLKNLGYNTNFTVTGSQKSTNAVIDEITGGAKKDLYMETMRFRVDLKA